jgi:hypothetical protein
MQRICTFILFTGLFAAVYGQGHIGNEVYYANPDPPTDGMVGSNYTPAYAVNQVQFWHNFRPDVVEKELAAAHKYYGITTLRVYLHNINFDKEKDVFLTNLEKFLKICERYEIKPGFVFFDDCHRRSGIFLDKPTTPVKGWHNGRWAACPQDRDRDSDNLEKFKPYVQEVISAHRTDKRVLWWEIFNEPEKLEYSNRLRRAGYQWAKDVRPIQPVLNCWDNNEVTDIVDAHNYRWASLSWDEQAAANTSKGTVFTEAGARWHAPRGSNGEPCEVINWLENRRESGRSTPGVYLNWELMAGNSNCRWYWGTSPDSPEPTMPWCGLMWPDATPVSLAESEACLRYTTGKGRALLYEDFQDIPIEQIPGWKVYGESERVGSGVLKISPGVKMITGDPNWKDCLVESVAMLKDTSSSAELMFRVSDLGPGKDEFHGYYVRFNTKKLSLGKRVQNRREELVSYDLSQLDCKVVDGVWNQLRVESKGKRIRVWFNRMHSSSDPDRGLRIDYTDTDRPISSGNIGFQAHGTGVWFDNVVVLPISETK